MERWRRCLMAWLAFVELCWSVRVAVAQDGVYEVASGTMRRADFTCRGRGRSGGHHRSSSRHSYSYSSSSHRSHRSTARRLSHLAHARRRVGSKRKRAHAFASAARVRRAGQRGCGSHNGPGFRLPNGKCASWADVPPDARPPVAQTAVMSAVAMQPAASTLHRQPAVVDGDHAASIVSVGEVARVDNGLRSEPTVDPAPVDVDPEVLAGPPPDSAPVEAVAPARCLLEDGRVAKAITCTNVEGVYPGRSVFWFVDGNVYSCSQPQLTCPAGSRCVVAMRNRNDWARGFATGICQ